MNVTSVSLPVSRYPAITPTGPSSRAPATPSPMARFMFLLELTFSTVKSLNSETRKFFPSRGFKGRLERDSAKVIFPVTLRKVSGKNDDLCHLECLWQSFQGVNCAPGASGRQHSDDQW